MVPPALAVVASEPPESPVCSLALCPRETQSPVLFTGHQDGVVFSWDLSPGGVAPYAYLLGHSAAVVAMVLQPSLQRVVTGSSDSHVRAWSVSTGECVAHASLDTSSTLRCMTATSRYVVVACTSGVTLLDAASLAVTRRLKATPQLLRAPLMALCCTAAAVADSGSPSGSSNTLSALASVRQEESDQVQLVGVDTSGSTWRWRGSARNEAAGAGSIGDAMSALASGNGAVSQVAMLGWQRPVDSTTSEDSPLTPLSRVSVVHGAAQRGPTSADVSADGKFVLLVSAEGWAVVPTATGASAAPSASVCGDGSFTGGAFLSGDSQRIMLWSDLPAAVCVIDVAASARPGPGTASRGPRGSRDLWAAQLSASVAGAASCTAGDSTWVVVASKQTTPTAISLYCMPTAELISSNQPLKLPSSASLPLARGCIPHGWQLDSSCDVDQPCSDADVDPVCVSCLAAWPPLLALGRSGGAIELRQLASGQLLATRCEHVGAVRCLTSTSAMLFSGGDDATVRCWSLSVASLGDCVCVLRHHVSPVTAFHLLGETCLLSESDDGAVGILHTSDGTDEDAHGLAVAPECQALLPPPSGGGDSRVNTALWMPSAGCVALRRGSCVEVWDVVTGVLDRRVQGVAAADQLLARLSAGAQWDGTHAARPSAGAAGAGASGGNGTKATGRPVSGDCRVPWAPVLQFDAVALSTRSDRDGLLALLPVLHAWGYDSQVDNLLTGLLPAQPGLDAQSGHLPTVAPALSGCDGAVTALTPFGASQHRLFATSGRLVAQRSLVMTLLARSLQRLGSEDAHRACAALLVAFYAVQLHTLPRVAPPALAVYAACWQHSNEHVREAARALLASAPAASVPAALRSDADFSWRTVEAACGGEPDASQSTTGRLGVLAAAGLAVASQRRSDGCSLHPSALARTLAALRALAYDAPAPHGSAAVALLAEGMAVWADTLLATNGNDRSSAGAFAQEALLLCERLAGSSSGPVGSATDVMVAREASSELLASLAVALPSIFLAALSSRLVVSDSAAHMTAFLALIRVVQTQPAVLSPHLDAAMEAICVACSAAPVTGSRRACATGATGALAELCARLPAYVAHHRGSGRIAVAPTHGSAGAPLVHVFELPHGLLRVLEAAPGEPVGGECAALSLDADGARVAAYHAAAGMLRFWVIGAPGSAAWRASRGLPPARSCTVTQRQQPGVRGTKFRLEFVSGIGAGVALLTNADTTPVCFLPVVGP